MSWNTCSKIGTLMFQNGEFSNPKQSQNFRLYFLKSFLEEETKIKYNKLKSRENGVLHNQI